LAAPKSGTAIICFACVSDNGELTYRELEVAPAELVEGGANTFAQVTLDTEITDLFSKNELNRGVVPIGVTVVIDPLSAASAIDKLASTIVQVTKGSQSALLNVDNSDLLAQKILFGCSSHDSAESYYYMDARRFPFSR
jgi:hypothetical protein